MGHAHGMTSEHQELAKRLQKGAVAAAEPTDPQARRAWQEILEILFSPRDAELAAQLPLAPASLAALQKRTGIGREELRRRLNDMAERALVLDLPDPSGEEMLYMLPPPVVGFFEFSLMRMDGNLPQKQLAEAYDTYIGGDPDESFVKEMSGASTLVGRALVHESTLDDLLTSEVLDWESAAQLVERASRIGLGQCFCRRKAHQLGKACAHPQETCMSFDGPADYVIGHGLGRDVQAEEALAVLEEARTAGRVQIADNTRDDTMYLCSCCGCCCEELASVSKHDLPIVAPSGFIARADESRCVGCGRCARACPIGAVALEAGDWTPVDAEARRRLHAQVDHERCLGCGVCAEACRKSAMRMERREARPYVPANSVEYLVRRVIERGRLADLLVDGTSRGARFTNTLLRTLTTLPPAEKLLASEQVKSRFVRLALSKSASSAPPAGEEGREGTQGSGG